MSLADIFSILGCIAVAVAVVILIFLRFCKMEEMYQADEGPEQMAVKKKYDKYYRYCFMAIIFGILTAVWK